MSFISLLSKRALLRPARSPVTLNLSPARRTLITLKDSLYTVTATSTGGRNGTISSKPSDETAPLDLKFRVPKAMGGSGDSGHNPEQLFAAGYSACFLGAIQVASTSAGKKEVGERAVVHADVDIGRTQEIPGMGLKVVLRVEGVEDQAILDAAHEICPYSRALREGFVVEVKKA